MEGSVGSLSGIFFRGVGSLSGSFLVGNGLLEGSVGSLSGSFLVGNGRGSVRSLGVDLRVERFEFVAYFLECESDAVGVVLSGLCSPTDEGGEFFNFFYYRHFFFLIKSIIECRIEDPEGLRRGEFWEAGRRSDGEGDNVEGIVFVGVLELLGGDDSISSG